MLLMKTEKVTLPMYGNVATIKGKKIKNPTASGHFLGKTMRPAERELALFLPWDVEGHNPDGWGVIAPEGYILDAAELVKHGHLDLFVDPAEAEKLITNKN